MGRFFPRTIRLNALHAFAFDVALARARLHYQIGDLGLGRTYDVSCTFKFRPFFGVKVAKQTHKGRYECAMNDCFNKGCVWILTETGQDLWGGGLRGGVQTFWQFSKRMGPLWTHRPIWHLAPLRRSTQRRSGFFA